MNRRRIMLFFVIMLLLMPTLVAYAQDTPAADETATEESADAPPSENHVIQFVKDAGHGENWLERIAIAVVIILIAMTVNWAIMAIIRRTIRRIESESFNAPPRVRQGGRRAVTVLGLLANVAKWVIGIGAFLWILSVMNVNLAPVLAGAGIVGIAIGFGAQTLVRDTISGFFLLLEGQYVVGDYVEVSGKFGLVETIGLRVTVLKDLDNQLHYIPNGTIAAVTVYEEHFVNYIIEVPLADAADADKATQIIQQVVEDMRDDFPRHLPLAGPAYSHVATNGSASVRIPAAVFPTQDWLATEEFPLRIQNALASAEIVAAEGRKIRTYPDLTRMPLPPPIEEAEANSSSCGRLI